MRTHTRSGQEYRRPVNDEDYFERKARELVVAEDEIEAWELDALDLGDHRDAFDAYTSE